MTLLRMIFGPTKAERLEHEAKLAAYRQSPTNPYNRIAAAMTEDGFPPPLRGDRQEAALTKIANYIEFLKSYRNPPDAN